MNPSSPPPHGGFHHVAQRTGVDPVDQVAGDPVGVAARHLGVGGHQERGEPQAGRAARRPDRPGEPGEVRGEAVVGVEPVADGRLVAVVDLEHVERPPVGQRPGWRRCRPRSRRGSTGTSCTSPTWKGAVGAGAAHPSGHGRPTARAAWRRPAASPGTTRTGWSGRRAPASEHGVTQEGLDPHLDGAVDLGDPQRPVVAVAALEARPARRSTPARGRRPAPSPTPTAARPVGPVAGRRGARPGGRGSRPGSTGRRRRRPRRRRWGSRTGSRCAACRTGPRPPATP